MVDADVAPVTKLLNEYLGNGEAKFYPIFDEEEVRHWFAPRDEVVCTYVVETEGTVTDFLSFYTLPSTVIGNPKHNSLKAAYSFYNVANTVTIEALMSAQHAGIFTTLSACLLLCPPPNLPIDRRRAPLSIPAAR